MTYTPAQNCYHYQYNKHNIHFSQLESVDRNTRGYRLWLDNKFILLCNDNAGAALGKGRIRVRRVSVLLLIFFVTYFLMFQLTVATIQVKFKPSCLPKHVAKDQQLN